MSYIGYKRTIQLDFNYEQVKNGVPKVNQQMALLNAEFNKASAQVKSTGSAMDKLVIQNQKLASQVQLQKDKVSTLKQELEKLTTAENKNQRAIASKQIELKNAEAKLTNLQVAYAGSNKELQKATTLSGQLKLAMEDMRLGFERAGINVEQLKGEFAALGVAVAAFVTATTGAFMKFESSMIKSRTIMDETAVSYKTMQQDVINMSDKYGISAKTMAEANYQILSSAIATADANKVLEQSAILAKTGFTDVATAADILTSIMNGYQLSVEDANTVVDQLIKTQKVGKLTIGELSASMGDLIGIASSVNVPITEVEAAIAAMTQSGIKADTAITNMKQILSAIANPSAGAAEAADKYRISMDAAAISSKGFTRWLEECLRKTKGNSAALGEMFGNVKSWSGMVTLAKKNGDAFSKCLDEIQNSGGAANTALELIEDTTGEKLDKSINSLKNSFIEMGDALSPLIELIASVISKISDIPAPVLLTIASFAALTITISLLKKLFSGLALASGVVGAVMTKLGLATGGAAAGMGVAAGSGGLLTKILTGLGISSGAAAAGIGATGGSAGATSAALGATAATSGGAAAGLTSVGAAGTAAGAGLTATGAGATFAMKPILIVIAALAALALIIALVAGNSKKMNSELDSVGSKVKNVTDQVKGATSSAENQVRSMQSVTVGATRTTIDGKTVHRGYATGTNFVKEDGWYQVEEGLRKEMYFHRGDQVVNADNTQAIQSQKIDMTETNVLLKALITKVDKVETTLYNMPKEQLRIART